MTDERKWSMKELAALGLRIKRAPRIRHFPFLGGWAIVLLPLDIFEFRGMARMYFGTMYGFKPDELIELRARRLELDDEGMRTWWVIAITPEAMRRSERRAEKDRAKAKPKKGKRT